MNNKIISIDTLKYYNDKISNYIDEKVSNVVDNLELDELNAILVDTDSIADDPNVPDYVTETELNTALSNKMDKVTLATVATSGSYNDLTNKPTIPSAVTESTVSDWGFTKNTGTYSKPSGGIPMSDLASAVQTSLGKADTALQSYTEQYKGTVTGVKINGTTKNPSNGVVDLGNTPTEESINNILTIIEDNEYVTATALIDLNERFTNLELNGGGGSIDTSNFVTSVKVNGQSTSPLGGVVDLGYINKQLSTTTASLMGLSPNIYYRNTSTSLSSLTIALLSIENEDIINEYFVEFTTSSSGTSVSLPSTIKWANGEAPTFEASTTYQISIINNLGVVTKFK